MIPKLKKKLKVQSPYGPAMSLLGMDATEMKARTGWEPLRAVLFTGARRPGQASAQWQTRGQTERGIHAEWGTVLTRDPMGMSPEDAALCSKLVTKGRTLCGSISRRH